MSTIKPFRAVRYNSEKVQDISKVVSPPYDVINADEQAELEKKSPYNFVRIDLAKETAEDDKDHNKYTRAKDLYEEWLKKGILKQDDKPGIYFYKQEYKIQGQKYSRTGFISLMTLENEEESKVVPHENTHAHAVEDRLKLLKSLHSSLSCIFVCYSDRGKKVEKIFNRIQSNPPLANVKDKDDVQHTIWQLTDPDAIKEINDTLEDQHIFIADGHHRFKVAMEYRQQQMALHKQTTGEEPYNYVLTYFTNIDSKDLKIFPMHRIVKEFPQDLSPLEEFFRIDKIRKEDLVILLAQAGKNENAFGLYMRGGVWLMRLKNKRLINDHVKEGSLDYKSLDATILKTFVFDRLGISSHDIIYTKDLNDVTSMVNEQKADAGFVLNPVKISQLKAIALNGERMPPKTTYFYPKVLSGLTVYKMD
ncbi:MAG: DUF1015 domain-containing protein [Candidatus Omnitrophica bacterium]|nr:DUF1015 domain-containing protein [Candidatus Omnitrophota bacterium]